MEFLHTLYVNSSLLLVSMILHGNKKSKTFVIGQHQNKHTCLVYVANFNYILPIHTSHKHIKKMLELPTKLNQCKVSITKIVQLSQSACSCTSSASLQTFLTPSTKLCQRVDWRMKNIAHRHTNTQDNISQWSVSYSGTLGRGPLKSAENTLERP